MNPDEKVLFGNLTVYRERGAYLRRLEQFNKSKAAYDEAFKTNPEDVRLLIGRSQVCSDAVKPIQAYEDAERALKLQPKSMLARNMQAQALFTISEFERSVVMNYRGLRHRRQPPYFKEGISQGIATINDCVGVNSGDVMLDFLPLIKQTEQPIENESELNKKKHVSRIPVIKKKVKITQLQARKTLTLNHVLAMKYLGPMAYDKFFLEDLKQSRFIKSANEQGSKELNNLIDETYRTLSERQEMLRAQRPYYVYKLAERTESKHQNIFKEKTLLKERENGARTAELILKSIEKCLRARDIKQLMSYAERMQSFLDDRTPHTLPDKDVYTDRLYRAVGEGYLCQYRISYTLSERSNRRRVAFLMGIPVGRPSSFDSVLAKYPHKFLDIKLAIKKVEKSLDMCENSTMRCWLMYEMSKLLCTQKNYALAKFYGNRLINEATEIVNHAWTLNGILVLLSIEMQQNNVNEIRVLVEEGLKRSKKLNDPECIQAFLRKCEEMSHDTPTADDRKIILQRERQILSVMDEYTQIEAGVLFKRMSTLPPGRRFPVVPSKFDASVTAPERTKRRQFGLTVVPGAPTELPPPQVSDTLGYQVFDV